MIVERIEDISAKKVQITLEGGMSFPLYRRELGIYNISEGASISEEDIDEIEKALIKRCKARAMNLLVKKNYTVHELQKKLYDGGYSEETVQAAMDYVTSFHYLDDERYAYSYIAARASSTSKRMISLNLKKKGIDKEVFERAFAEYMDSEGGYSSEELILNLMKKKNFDSSTATPKDKQKIYSFLLRKGFDSSEIMHCMNIYE